MSEHTHNDIKQATRAYAKWLAVHADKMDLFTLQQAQILGHALWVLCQPGAAEVPTIREGAMRWAREVEARLSTFRTERPSAWNR